MKRKKLTASMIALVMSVSLPMTTYAANWYLEDGSVTVNADNSGQTVTQGGTSTPDEAPVITQRESSVETGNTITINAAENATANVTISDVNINTSDAAVSTSGKGNVNIELDGTNTLKSGVNHAGLEKNSDGNQGKLTITDENENGKLIATGGNGAAGIGGGLYAGGNDITIIGGEITATGGECGAGIGGGFYTGGNDITIAGGKVTATGGDYGAGIGGGNQGNGSNITITDGEVAATGGTNGAGIGGGLRKNGEKITVSGDATLKVQGGPTDTWDGAGAGIGNGGSHNGEFSGSFIPVNGAETEPDTSNLTTGKIEYYAPGADMTKDEPTSTILGSGQPTSPGETAAPVEYRMQTSASEPVQGNGKSTGYKAPVQGHFYQVVGQDGKTMIFATAQKKDVLAIATDSDFAMLTGKMEDIEALRKQGVRRIIFATKRSISTFLLSELLEKRAYGEIWSLIHDGENVAFTAVEKMMDISSILTRL
ncbi:MAG: hypothetical protein ACLTR4_05260 [Gallintestinimicrobium sp.]